MKQYLDLLQDVLKNGERMENRTGIDTLSVFGRQLRFDLREGFPLVTTKKVHMRSIVHELIWMLSGSTNIDYLRQNNVTIWDSWSSKDYLPELGYEEGELGPVYGSQWRSWPGRTNLQCDGKIVDLESREIGPGRFAMVTRVYDQIDDIVDRLRNKPQDRRIILSAWNVADIPKMKLPPCHCFAQFSVRGPGLACHMYIRSWDLFLGGPFNIAQYALLTHVLARVADLDPYELIISAGDAHLYVNHLEQVHTQLEREPKLLPILEIDARVREIDDFTYEDVTLDAYDYHPAIKAPVAV